MYYLYIIRCKDKTLYTGISTDVKRRFKEHQSRTGGAYTHSHPVDKIVYTEKLKDRGSALKREGQIKSWPRKKKLTLLFPS